MNKLIIIVFAALLLSSCSLFTSNNDSLYLQSHNGKPLEVPPPLTKSEISTYYDLPDPSNNPVISLEPPME